MNPCCPEPYPRPQWLRLAGEGCFLGEDLPVVATPASAPAARLLARVVERDWGMHLEVVEQTPAAGRLVVDVVGSGAAVLPGLEVPKASESYALKVDARGMTLVGRDLAGARLGVQTLRQLLYREGGQTWLAGAEVRDWPAQPLRGAHLFMPGRQNLSFFRRLLEVLASLKHNTVFLEVGGGMAYERHPEINAAWERFCREAGRYPGGPAALQHSQPFPKASPHTEVGGGSFLTKEEVRSLVEFARDLGLEVVPEAQSLTHSYYLVLAHPEIAERPEDPYPDTYCPENPASYRLYFDVLEEVIEVFQPRMVHIGHDELWSHGLCPRCRGKSGAKLLAGDVTRIHDFLAQRDIRTVMWADKLIPVLMAGRDRGGGRRVERGGHGPRAWFQGGEVVVGATYQAIDLIPKDILLFDWKADADSSSQDYFGAHGFEQVFANFGGNLGVGRFPHWRRRSRAENVRGGVVSSWCDNSLYALAHNGVLLRLLVAAQMLWWEGYEEHERPATLEAIAGLMPRVRRMLSEDAAPVREPRAGAWTPIALADRGNALADYPAALLRGEMRVGEVPFLPPSAAAGGGGEVLRVSEEVGEVSVPVAGRVGGVSFLWSCRCHWPFPATWGQQDVFALSSPVLLAALRAEYEDGSTARTEVRYGIQVADWDEHYGETTVSAPVFADPVRVGRDERGRPVTLYHYHWQNPHPDQPLTRICLAYAGGDRRGHLDLLAVTALRPAGTCNLPD